MIFGTFEIVIFFIAYLAFVFILTCGISTFIDTLELVGRHISTQVPWTSSLIFVLLTATLYYLIIFDESGVSSPAWTTYRG